MILLLVLAGLVWLLGAERIRAATVPLEIPQSDDPNTGSDPRKMEVFKGLELSFNLLEKGNFEKSEVILKEVLKKEPGNPLALNNMAAIMVKQNKYDKAYTYLNQALPRAKGYLLQINRVCQVRGLFLAFKPGKGAGDQELEPLIKMNIDMILQYMSLPPLK